MSKSIFKIVIDKSGKITRSEFAKGYFFNLAINTAYIMIAFQNIKVISAIMLPLNGYLIYSGLIIQIKRLRDMARSGWLVLCPTVLTWIIIALTVKSSADALHNFHNMHDAVSLLRLWAVNIAIIGFIHFGFLIWLFVGPSANTNTDDDNPTSYKWLDKYGLGDDPKPTSSLKPMPAALAYNPTPALQSSSILQSKTNSHSQQGLAGPKRVVFGQRR